MAAPSATGKNQTKSAVGWKSTKTTMPQAKRWAWRPKTKHRSKTKHFSSELMDRPVFFIFLISSMGLSSGSFTSPWKKEKNLRVDYSDRPWLKKSWFLRYGLCELRLSLQRLADNKPWSTEVACPKRKKNRTQEKLVEKKIIWQLSVKLRIFYTAQYASCE